MKDIYQLDLAEEERAMKDDPPPRVLDGATGLSMVPFTDLRELEGEGDLAKKRTSGCRV